MTPDKDLEALRHELRDRLRMRAGPTLPTPACLDDTSLARLADGAMSGAERTAALVHVAGCARCRADLAETIRILQNPAVARSNQGGGVQRQILRIAVPLAAAAVLLLLLWPTGPDGEPHRERGVLAVQAPEPHAPLGVVAGGRSLTWSPVQGADRYRITLFEGGRVLYDTELRDTVAVVPDSVRISAGVTYLWKVAARTGFDRWVSSDLVRFTVAAEPRR